MKNGPDNVSVAQMEVKLWTEYDYPFLSCDPEITPAWYELISLRCNLETVLSLCAKNNSSNGFYTQNKMKNGLGTVSISQVEVKLCTEYN